MTEKVKNDIECDQEMHCQIVTTAAQAKMKGSSTHLGILGRVGFETMMPTASQTDMACFSIFVGLRLPGSAVVMQVCVQGTGASNDSCKRVICMTVKEEMFFQTVESRGSDRNVKIMQSSHSALERTFS